MKIRHVVTLVTLSLILVSCGDEVPAADPTGEAWQLESGVIDGTPIPVLDGHPITLSFTEDDAGGTAACNGYGGGYRLSGTSISFEPPAVTEMACAPPEVMDSESMYLSALIRVSGFSLEEGRLRLTGEGVELVFASVPPVPAADLTGTVWVLESLVDGDTVSSVMGDRATLELFTDGSAIGSTGCRTFTARYELDGADVRMIDLQMNGECDPGLSAQDAHVVSVLGDGFQAEIVGSVLTAVSRGGNGLAYRAEAVPE